MPIQFRQYTVTPGITRDYALVRDFFVKCKSAVFTYARWDWMALHGYLDVDSIGRIGLWFEDGSIVAAATFDCQMGTTYLPTLPEYENLRCEMIAYAEKYLNPGSAFNLAIPDDDRDFQSVAADKGFIATPCREHVAAFYPDETPAASNPPEGFSITDLDKTFDPRQYHRILWKGFDHEANGEGPFESAWAPSPFDDVFFDHPHMDRSLKIAAVGPDGNFAAFCGMWYDPAAGCAVVEPVAVDPASRLKGLGRAVVLEGISRVAARGARIVFVGSEQQFYYSIGFRPFATATLWRKP